MANLSSKQVSTLDHLFEVMDKATKKTEEEQGKANQASAEAVALAESEKIKALLATEKSKLAETQIELTSSNQRLTEKTNTGELVKSGILETCAGCSLLYSRAALST